MKPKKRMMTSHTANPHKMTSQKNYRRPQQRQRRRKMTLRLFQWRRKRKFLSSPLSSLLYDDRHFRTRRSIRDVITEHQRQFSRRVHVATQPHCDVTPVHVAFRIGEQHPHPRPPLWRHNSAEERDRRHQGAQEPAATFSAIWLFYCDVTTKRSIVVGVASEAAGNRKGSQVFVKNRK